MPLCSVPYPGEVSGGGEGLTADYDAGGKLAGIEILDALKRFGGSQTLRQVILEDVEPVGV